MELQFRESAISALNSFAAHYERAWCDLFRDTGLWNESSIIDGFKKSAKKMRDTILAGIEAQLIERDVLGRKTVGRDWHEIYFHVGSRLVIVHYSEDRKEKIRWVESISVDRKAIIF